MALLMRGRKKKKKKKSTNLISLGKFQSCTLLSWKLYPSVQTGHKDTGEGLDMRCPSTTLGALLLISFSTSSKGKEEIREHLIAL